jgi:hypothetical protein
MPEYIKREEIKLFERVLYIIFTDNIGKTLKRISIEDNSNPLGISHWIENTFYLIINYASIDNKELGGIINTISHESSHISDFLYESINHKKETFNSEPHAYAVGYFTEITFNYYLELIKTGKIKDGTNNIEHKDI